MPFWAGVNIGGGLLAYLSGQGGIMEMSALGGPWYLFPA